VNNQDNLLKQIAVGVFVAVVAGLLLNQLSRLSPLDTPTPVPSNQTRITGSLLAGVPVQSGATLPAGSAVIVREIRGKEVWIWYTSHSDRPLTAQQNYDLWKGDADYWTWISGDACREAKKREVEGFTVHFQGDGPPPGNCG
jgi:hypothetical protein